MQYGFKLVLETILLASELGLPIFFQQMHAISRYDPVSSFSHTSKVRFSKHWKTIQRTDKTNKQYILLIIYKSRSAYNKILQYLQDSGHNDDNNENYKNYLHRGPL